MQLPYAHPGYGDLLRPSDGRLYAAVREDAESTVLYPFVLRPIGDGQRHDITSPYGYGGPLHWGSADAEDVAERFWAGFDQWAQSNAVVAEFIRFSLFDDVLPYPGMKRSRNLNFVCELPGTEDELWASLHKKVRQGVRRAQRMGLDIVVDTTNTRIDDFFRIYSGTMARRESDDWYRFSEEFFEGLHAAMGDRTVIVCVLHEGRAVAANLLLMGSDAVYAFLGGTDEEAFSMRPTEFMEFHSMNWARENGYRHYVLGGGVRPGDSLEGYKKRFAPNGGVLFHTGERILDPRAFDELVAARRREFEEAAVPWDEETEFFPRYRAPIPHEAPTAAHEEVRATL